MSDIFTIEDARAFIEEGTMSLPFTLKLTKPIKLGEDTVSEITFKNEPTAADVEKMPVKDQNMGHFYPVISKMTGQTLVGIRRLSFKDLQNAMELSNHFLGGSEEIGEDL
tara:strand:+ start:190 stop:519 length:330 start_codon:yes stop_codon:yes gene_type:complete